MFLYLLKVSEVQNEWQRIRERFSRERKKNGQPDSRKPWELMPHLEFLKKVVKYRRNRQIRRRTLPVDAILSVSASYDNFPNVSSESKLEFRNEENSCVDVSSADYDCIDNTLASYACTNRSSTECEVSASTPTPAVKRPKLYVPATSRQVTPQTNSALFSVKQREGDTLKETLNTYLSVAAEMSQNINTFLHNRSERSPSTHDPDEESLRGFIMGFLPFWKAIGLKERATLMSSVTALFADALQKSEAPK
ncbi:uncharacterized protein LOC134533864 isoform X2 [Bacillus rossius redtenbacheri]|uniref:uncharacterized protein LOC134533864 isoform X2 n=1 Tax=Bacillus rossius redtenbacheri TaxID=93214 RepID=UPI002FDDD190